LWLVLKLRTTLTTRLAQGQYKYDLPSIEVKHQLNRRLEKAAGMDLQEGTKNGGDCAICARAKAHIWRPPPTRTYLIDVKPCNDFIERNVEVVQEIHNLASKRFKYNKHSNTKILWLHTP